MAVRSFARTHLLTRSAIVVALFSAVLLAETCSFARRHSITYDETIYLNLSLQSLRDHRLDPQFIRLGVAPLPALLTYVGPLLFTAPVEPARPSVQAGRPIDRQLIRWPRHLNALFIATPLLILVFVWLLRRRGLMTALLGAGLTAMSPTLIAHASLATTDESLALFGTLGLAAIAWCANAPTMKRLAVCAAAIAAAMSAKYTAVYLLPVAAVVLLLASRRRQPASATSAVDNAVLQIALLVCLVLPLWWAGHFFLRVTPDDLADPASRTQVTRPGDSDDPFAGARHSIGSLAPVAGIERQIAHSREGDPAFLLGKQSTSGWWYYFPLMFAFKSTPAELFLAGFLLVGAMSLIRHPWRTLTTLDASMQCLLVATGVLAGFLLTSHLNLGHRYMIAVYPILIIAGCDRLSTRLKDRPTWMTAAAFALIASQAWSSVTIAPHYLAYVNAWSGGPGHGYRLMADSSLDWGQDLPDLAAYLGTHDHGPVAIKYFGTALPDAYGVEADDIEHLRRGPEEYGVLALSVTYLNGLHLRGRDPFKDFRRFEPDAQVGYSIMVYELRRPEVLDAFRAAIKGLNS